MDDAVEMFDWDEEAFEDQCLNLQDKVCAHKQEMLQTWNQAMCLDKDAAVATNGSPILRRYTASSCSSLFVLGSDLARRSFCTKKNGQFISIELFA